MSVQPQECSASTMEIAMIDRPNFMIWNPNIRTLDYCVEF